VLSFGVTDPVTNVGNTLQMQWNPLDDNSPAQAGWSFIFGTDPDITNHVLTLSINPPGLGNAALPGGMTHVEVHVVDGAGGRSGWGFNTDQGGAVPLGNDPIPGGKAPVVPPPAPAGI